MVELPRVPRRQVTTQAPQSRVNPSDIAAPYQALARMLGEGGDALLNYEKAAGARQYARIGEEARNNAQKLAIDANGDANVFQSSWDAYSRRLVQKAPLSLRKQIADDLLTLGGNQYRTLVGAGYERDIKSSKAAIDAELDRIVG